MQSINLRDLYREHEKVDVGVGKDEDGEQIGPEGGYFNPGDEAALLQRALFRAPRDLNILDWNTNLSLDESLMRVFNTFNCSWWTPPPLRPASRKQRKQIDHHTKVEFKDGTPLEATWSEMDTDLDIICFQEIHAPHGYFTYSKVPGATDPVVEHQFNGTRPGTEWMKADFFETEGMAAINKTYYLKDIKSTFTISGFEYDTTLQCYTFSLRLVFERRAAVDGGRGEEEIRYKGYCMPTAAYVPRAAPAAAAHKATPPALKSLVICVRTNINVKRASRSFGILSWMNDGQAGGPADIVNHECHYIKTMQVVVPPLGLNQVDTYKFSRLIFSKGISTPEELKASDTGIAEWILEPDAETGRPKPARAHGRSLSRGPGNAGKYVPGDEEFKMQRSLFEVECEKGGRTFYITTTHAPFDQFMEKYWRVGGAQGEQEAGGQRIFNIHIPNWTERKEALGLEFKSVEDNLNYMPDQGAAAWTIPETDNILKGEVITGSLTVEATVGTLRTGMRDIQCNTCQEKLALGKKTGGWKEHLVYNAECRPDAGVKGYKILKHPVLASPADASTRGNNLDWVMHSKVEPILCCGINILQQKPETGAPPADMKDMRGYSRPCGTRDHIAIFFTCKFGNGDPAFMKDIIQKENDHNVQQFLHAHYGCDLNLDDLQDIDALKEIYRGINFKIDPQNLLRKVCAPTLAGGALFARVPSGSKTSACSNLCMGRNICGSGSTYTTQKPRTGKTVRPTYRSQLMMLSDYNRIMRDGNATYICIGDMNWAAPGTEIKYDEEWIHYITNVRIEYQFQKGMKTLLLTDSAHRGVAPGASAMAVAAAPGGGGYQKKTRKKPRRKSQRKIKRTRRRKSRKRKNKRTRRKSSKRSKRHTKHTKRKNKNR
jgi:hypothetical protein